MLTAAEGVGGGKKLSVSAILFTLLSYLLNACLIQLPPSTSISLCGFLFLQLLEAQADYHRKSLTVLENVLPTVQAQQGNITCERARHRCKKKKSRTKKGSVRGMTGELCVCFLKNANVVFISSNCPCFSLVPVLFGVFKQPFSCHIHTHGGSLRSWPCDVLTWCC